MLALVVTGCPYNPEEHGYVQVWSDEFDGTQLDTFRWETHVPFQPAPNPGEIVVSDGTLKLRSIRSTGEHWTAITTLGPRSPSEPNYPNALTFEEGYFEARVRYTDDGYSFPAVWLLSSAVAEAYPDRDTHCPTLAAELDIMEGLVPTGVAGKPERATGTLHRNTWLWADDPDGTCGQPDTITSNPREAVEGEVLHDWHVWAARWTADEVCWYLDREQYACEPTFDSTAQPMHLILTSAWYAEQPCRSWLYPTGCPPKPDFTELEVDYVRVWELTD